MDHYFKIAKANSSLVLVDWEYSEEKMAFMGLEWDIQDYSILIYYHELSF